MQARLFNTCDARIHLQAMLGSGHSLHALASATRSVVPGAGCIKRKVHVLTARCKAGACHGTLTAATAQSGATPRNPPYRSLCRLYFPCIPDVEHRCLPLGSTISLTSEIFARLPEPCLEPLAASAAIAQWDLCSVHGRVAFVAARSFRASETEATQKQNGLSAI